MKPPRWPRAPLAILPTPLVPARRLSQELGVEIWFKRDDLTGLGLGGNKVRALEHLIGRAQSEGAKVLVTGGGPQSNWVFLAALAAVTAGLRAHAVLYGGPVEASGNLLLLSALPGIEITFTGDADRASVDAGIELVAERSAAAGVQPYAVGRGGASATGALGYLTAVAELDDQLREHRLTPTTVWLATGSCGTQAGLVAGHALSPSDRHIVGVSVSRPAAECRQRIVRLSTAALSLVSAEPRRLVSWSVTDDQRGRYGVASPAGAAAAALVARTEGVLLDPVFGAKAMAGLVAAARAGAVTGPVVFLVSGGAPTLFAPGVDG